LYDIFIQGGKTKMSKRFFGNIILLFLFFINYFYAENNNQKELSIKLETAKLLNRAELAITNPDEFFDGKKANKNDIILPVINITNSKNEINDGNEFKVFSFKYPKFFNK
jgi:hypothetical protein